MRKATICLAIFLLNITPAIAIDVIEVDKKNEFPTEVTVRYVLDCIFKELRPPKIRKLKILSFKKSSCPR